MKKPEKAPDWKNIRLIESPELLVSLQEAIRKANSEYIYWDRFKYQSLPEGVTHVDAWATLKGIRTLNAYKDIPLQRMDKNFSYWVPDSAHDTIALIDRKASGHILTDDPDIYVEEKQRSIMRSLMDEAITSSQLEGAVTTRVLAEEMLLKNIKPRNKSERMIYNNYSAIKEIKKLTGLPLSPELLMDIHKHITRDTMENPSQEGHFRDEEVHILDMDGQNILHTPPPATEIEPLIEVMCEFINAKDSFTHPLIKAILLHFWIAYIHPFIDGNGRTSRALFYWFMLKNKYWLFEYLSISKVIMAAPIKYYRAFLYSEIDDCDLTYFITYNLEAIQNSLEDVMLYLEKRKVEARSAVRFLANYPGLNHRQRALLADALDNPHQSFTFDKHVKIHGTARQTARTDLLGLKDMGLLTMRKAGRRFVFTPVADLAEKLRP